MDEKVTKKSFKDKRDWERYILASEPKLSKGCTKSTLLAWVRLFDRYQYFLISG